MVRPYAVTAALALVLIGLTACNPATPVAAPPAAPSAAPTAAVMPTAEATALPTAAVMPTAEATAPAEATSSVQATPTSDSAARPAWQQLPLVDARTGETFRLADFAGRTVYVETMATWCPNCRAQLGNLREARTQLDSEKAIFVALSVETNLNAADLAAYAEGDGFDWTFAVLTPEMLQALVDVFGRSVANPPVTPSFIVRSDGTTTELSTGPKPAADIVAEINALTGN